MQHPLFNPSRRLAVAWSCGLVPCSSPDAVILHAGRTLGEGANENSCGDRYDGEPSAWVECVLLFPDRERISSEAAMKAIVTVGLGFGDEGKGATVDYLVRTLNAELVVRYSGGAQAGHNVELPDGRRHTFAQFGAGTLAGAKTYLGPRMIISPATILPEADHLRALGVTDPFALLSVHPDCLVSTAYHVWMNRLRETARGDGRHGSCGLGIGEARHYWLRYGQDAVFARDLHDRPALVAKLSLLRDRFLLEMQELSRLDDDLASLVYRTTPSREADILRRASSGLAFSSRLPKCETAIFEGAQGVLLDEWKGFHPYTTWSTVTAHHALELIEEHGITHVTVLGITRAYSTRHGAGPFPTWCPEMSAQIVDRGNPTNGWQGSIRSGPLDLVLLEYATRVCPVDGLVVNGLDQLPPRPRICTAYEDASRLEAPRSLQDQARLTARLEAAVPVLRETSVDEILQTVNDLAPVMITAGGPSHRDRSPTNGRLGRWGL
jgi:adenylosuccinate synthase